jgi:hypothetical protein
MRTALGSRHVRIEVRTSWILKLLCGRRYATGKIVRKKVLTAHGSEADNQAAPVVKLNGMACVVDTNLLMDDPPRALSSAGGSGFC